MEEESREVERIKRRDRYGRRERYREEIYR